MPLVTRNGVPLHYEDVGRGPVIFFHTGGGGDGTMWQSAGYLDALSEYRCLLFDHRGHGRSGRPDDLRAHAIDEYVADVVAVLDAAGVEQCAMVGYSDGARLIYKFAARHSGRVSAIVGIGGVSHPDEPSMRWRTELAHEVRTLGFRAWLEQMSAAESEPAPQWLLENLGSTPEDMFCLELEGWAEGHTECADFPSIKAPTLIVCGELEDTDGASSLAVEALPDGLAVVVPGFGHLQAFYRADVTAPIVREFLNRHMRVPGHPGIQPMSLP